MVGLTELLQNGRITKLEAVKQINSYVHKLEKEDTPQWLKEHIYWLLMELTFKVHRADT